MDKIKLNKIFFSLLPLIIILSISATVFGREYNRSYAQPTLTTETRQIAVILPLSGPFAEYGKALQQGYKLGFAEVTATANIAVPQYKIEYLDSEADPENVRTLINMLSSEGDVAIATGTPLNATAWTASHACEKNGLPYLIVGADQDNLINNETVYSFRLTQNSSSREQILSDFIAAQKPEIKSMGIIYSSASAGAINKARKLRKICTKKSIDLTIWKQWKKYNNNRDNFYDLLNTIKEHQPQILFLVTEQTVANRLWQQGKRLGIMPQATITIPINCLDLDFQSGLATKPADQLIYATPWPAPEFSLTDTLSGETDTSYWENMLSAQGSAAAKVILTCLQKSENLSATAIVKSMESIKIETVYGQVSFSKAQSGHQNHLPWYLCRNNESEGNRVIFPALK